MAMSKAALLKIPQYSVGFEHVATNVLYRREAVAADQVPRVAEHPAVPPSRHHGPLGVDALRFNPSLRPDHR